jgi:hypothetical protein
MQTETAALEEDESQQRGDPIRPHRFASPFSSLWLALWRLRQSVRLLLAVGFGILIAVVLICTVPLYANLVTNVQLQHQLSIQTPPDLNVEVDTTLAPVTSATAADVLTATASRASDYVNSFAPKSTWYMRLDDNFPPVEITHTPVNETAIGPLNPVLQPYVFDLPDALPHMDIVSGRLPAFTTANQMPEIMTVKKLGLKPGNTISIQFLGLHHEGGRSLDAQERRRSLLERQC